MLEEIDWIKVDGLIPTIVQSGVDQSVLMLGYMNQDALRLTLAEGQLCFYSRTKQRLWRKGETSGNVLLLKDLRLDCDGDTLLATVTPTGPVCHTGADNCFGTDCDSITWLHHLEHIIASRAEIDNEGSYTHRLIARGPQRVAQKVGEEGVELALASALGHTEEVRNESADLLFHFLVNLHVQGLCLQDVISCLQERHKERVEA